MINALKKYWWVQVMLLLVMFIAIQEKQWLAVPVSIFAGIAVIFVELFGGLVDRVNKLNRELLKNNSELVIRVIHLSTLNRQLRHRLGEEYD